MLRARQALGAVRIPELVRLSEGCLAAGVPQQHACTPGHEHWGALPTLAAWYMREMSSASQQPRRNHVSNRSIDHGICDGVVCCRSSAFLPNMLHSGWGGRQVRLAAAALVRIEGRQLRLKQS